MPKARMTTNSKNRVPLALKSNGRRVSASPSHQHNAEAYKSRSPWGASRLLQSMAGLRVETTEHLGFRPASTWSLWNMLSRWNLEMPRPRICFVGSCYSIDKKPVRQFRSAIARPNWTPTSLHTGYISRSEERRGGVE